MSVVYRDDWLTIQLGDCREELGELGDGSVQTVITSPPYWGLRDYGVDGQLGLEATPEAYVAAMVDVFREVRRVLRPDGTLWLNLGDSYAAAPGAAQRGNRTGDRSSTLDRGCRVKGRTIRASARRDNLPIPRSDYAVTGLKPKDRLLMPARVALALQADGWWLRDEIVWHKPNPMPSSVRDRTTSAHEMVYLLSKSARYHYDAAAIAEPVSENTHSRGGRDVPAGWNAASFAQGDGAGSRTAANNPRVKVPGGWDIEPGSHETIHRNGRTSATYHEAGLSGNVAASTERQRVGLNARWDASESNGSTPQTRNRRSVWTIATQPYPDAHYATFPEALVEPMILAGCPEGGVVLDPFAGSGTTGSVANRLGRRAILIDISGEYMAQITRRTVEGVAVPLGIEVPA